MKPLRPSLHLRRRQAIYLIPNLFTTANLFCGLYSIIAAFNGEYLNASSAILVALIFDVLDGQTARLTKTTSQFWSMHGPYTPTACWAWRLCSRLSDVAR